MGIDFPVSFLLLNRPTIPILIVLRDLVPLSTTVLHILSVHAVIVIRKLLGEELVLLIRRGS